jgi:hypothetical protein
MASVANRTSKERRDRRHNPLSQERATNIQALKGRISKTPTRLSVTPLSATASRSHSLSYNVESDNSPTLSRRSLTGPYRPAATIGHRQINPRPQMFPTSETTQPDEDSQRSKSIVYASKEERKSWQDIYESIVLEYIREGPEFRQSEKLAERIDARWREQFSPPLSDKLDPQYVREVFLPRPSLICAGTAKT